MTRCTTKTFQHAISALLFRRGEMMEELAVLRERQAALANGADDPDRTLESSAIRAKSISPPASAALSCSTEGSFAST